MSETIIEINSEEITETPKGQSPKHAIKTESAAAPASDALQQSIASLCLMQKNYFEQGNTISKDARSRALKNLRAAIQLHEAEVLEALEQDLGKSRTEGYMTEVGMVYEEIDWQLRHLSSMMRQQPHLTPLHEFPASSMTVRIPYGRVLILSPWNYPFMLCLMPLADALAAGNTAIVKPGHYSQNTAAIIQKIIRSVFDPAYMACLTGGREVISTLLDQQFDYIFFTGGKDVGHLVMESAAKNLTPLTLELGGKSPAVVDKDSNLVMAARRIVFGKLLNAGQTCVAPDYVYVHEDIASEFISLLCREFQRQMPNPACMGKIISEKHYQRLISLITPDRVVYGGKASAPTRQIEPTVLYPANWQDPAMQQEIFGPILPVLTFSDFHTVMKEIQSRPDPLAFYLFTRSNLHKNYYKFVQPFGGGCINDTVIQLATENMPFGGMGASGMGQYHGRYGFETFSHTKSIVDKATWLDLPMRYANRKPWMDKVIRIFLH